MNKNTKYVLMLGISVLPSAIALFWGAKKAFICFEKFIELGFR